MPEHVRRLSSLDPKEFSRTLDAPEVNLALFSGSRNFSQAIHAERARINRSFQYWSLRQDQSRIAPELRARVREEAGLSGPLSDQLSEDVLSLVDLFSRISGEEAPFVSFRSISEAYFQNNRNSVSRCFHYDTAVMTLFKTYYGTGTQWVENRNVKRKAFENVAIQEVERSLDEFIHDPDAIQETYPWDVGILKGEINSKKLSASQREFLDHFLDPAEIADFNIGQGLIHRGLAPAAAEVRLVLTVSSFKKGRIVCC